MNGSDAADLTAKDKYHQLAERRHRTRQKHDAFAARQLRLDLRVDAGLIGLARTGLIVRTAR